MAVELYMPKMSDFMEEGEVVGWLVAEGDRVEEGQPLMELETDKSLVELESPASGFIKGMRAGIGRGTKVPVGETLAFIVESMDETVETLAPFDSTG